MDAQLTALEILGWAIRSEEDAAGSYGHIPGMVNNGLVKERSRHDSLGPLS